ncbi:putative outer membrane protein, probably involved in nutrient binding [unidentified eubacterium SCB49]|nr:putative outer membrane protein, probably involved in nutrient binding [unidentified eubacterium SCB49]
MKNLYLLLLIIPSLLFAKEIKPKVSAIKNVTVFLEGASIERTATFNIAPGENILIFNDLSPDIDESSIQFSGLKNTSILSLSYDINFLEKKALSKEHLSFKNKIDSLDLKNTLIDNEVAGYNEELNLLSNNRKLSSETSDLNLEKVKILTTYYRKRITEIKNELQQLNLQKVKISEAIRDYGNEMLKLQDNKEKERGEIILKLDAPSAINLVLTFTYNINNAGWFPLYDVRATDINSPVSFSYKANVYQQSGTDWNNVNVILSTGDPTTNNTKPFLESKWLRFVSPNYRANKAVGNTSRKYNPKVGTVSGYVYDNDGHPLPGANVILKGTSNGTQTDFNGKYSLNTSGSRTLQFSYLGFESQELPISASTVNVTLNQGAELDEVVIAGYSRSSARNIDKALQGRAAGVQVTTANGKPGQGSYVRIRGAGSLNAGADSPLYIVDGVPMNESQLQDIDEDMIADITILKDSATTARYGSRGTNGVVVITLKNKTASGNFKEEGLTNTRFEIKKKYTIKSNQEITVIEVNKFDFPATFKHYAAPELNENVFLTANIKGWEKYDLLYGEANIYFNGTYAGKTIINPLATEEELELSMGVDPNIIITRKKLDNFKSKSFLGANRIVAKAYEIKVKNTKQSTITLLIEDRIPISQNKEIKIDDLEYGDAEFDEEKGILKWRITLGANKDAAKRLSYVIKYPRYKTVNF